MRSRPHRHILPALTTLAVGGALAVGGTLGLGGAPATGGTLGLGGALAPAASAHLVNAQQATSQNWAGYVAASNVGNGRFSSVSGSWVVPTVSPSAGQGYSAFWVGLGGSSNQSQALEQVGTSADTTGGQTQYYAWYELVPAPETRLDLAVHPGDHISGKVGVSGSTVTISLSDQTTGQSVTKQLQMSNPDTSSAEWIAEAPSSQSQFGDYRPLPLADFGNVTFTNAYATSGGHTGSISDSDWSLQQVQLASANGSWAGGGAGIAGGGAGFVSTPSGAGAQPSSLSNDGTSFSVSYTSGGSAGSGVDSAGAATSGGGYPDGYGDGGGTVYLVPVGGGYAYVVPGGYGI